MRKKLLILTMMITLGVGLSGCIVKPFRFDIQQGNNYPFERVHQVRTGMSKEQVSFILGSPSLQDVFHSNRWDYIYYLNPRKGPVERKHFAIVFQDGVVDAIIEDNYPISGLHA